MRHYKIFLWAMPILFLFSCVSSKKFKSEQTRYCVLEVQYKDLQGQLNKCNDDKTELNRQKTGLESDKEALNNRIADLNRQIDLLRENNTSALKQLQDMSVISSSQAESIK